VECPPIVDCVTWKAVQSIADALRAEIRTLGKERDKLAAELSHETLSSDEIQAAPSSASV